MNSQQISNELIILEEKLKNLTESGDMTTRDFCYIGNISHQMNSYWRNEKSQPSIDTLLTMGKNLEIILNNNIRKAIDSLEDQMREMLEKKEISNIDFAVKAGVNDETPRGVNWVSSWKHGRDIGYEAILEMAGRMGL